MSPELALKIITTIFALAGAAKLIYDLTAGTGTRLREEYRFAKAFLEEVKSQDLHPYAIEKGYQAIAGSSFVNTAEVAYVLSLENPARRLKDYTFSREHLIPKPSNGGFRFEFKKKYRGRWARTWRKWLFLVSYAVSGAIMVFPLIFSGVLNLSLPQLATHLVTTLPVFGYAAWLSLMAYVGIKRGEDLVANQVFHEKNVALLRNENLSPNTVAEATE